MTTKTDVTVNTNGTVSLYRAGRKVWGGPVSELMAQLTGADAPPLPTRKPKKQKPKSRSARWSDACDAAMSALEDLRSVQEEYEEWKDNLPENLQQSALGEKLDSVCEIDIEGAKDSVEEAQNADLPQGFGRD